MRAKFPFPNFPLKLCWLKMIGLHWKKSYFLEFWKKQTSKQTKTIFKLPEGAINLWGATRKFAPRKPGNNRSPAPLDLLVPWRNHSFPFASATGDGQKTSCQLFCLYWQQTMGQGVHLVEPQNQGRWAGAKNVVDDVSVCVPTLSNSFVSMNFIILWKCMSCFKAAN